MIKIQLKNSIDYLNGIMKKFNLIGIDEKGGVTRLAYTKEEDLMHEEFSSIAKEEGYLVEIDEVGNTFVSIKKHKEYHLVGSHLDSVVNGGKFDGVIGVATGLLLLKIIKANNLDIPLKIAAFRCEESSNFMKSTLGSGLITGENYTDQFEDFKSLSGIMLKDIFRKRSYNQTPKKIEGVKSYLELHIEQGRILESEGLKIGVVDAIAGNNRLKVNIKGLAEHSGATPMDLRRDALCGASEIIFKIETVVQDSSENSAVATVGFIENFPNSINVIPGEVEFAVDIRDVTNNSMENIRFKIEKLISQICEKRSLSYNIQSISKSDAVVLDEKLKNQLSDIASSLKIPYKIMSSGAGHDAMKFADITKTGMIFIPCKDGISHNPKEDANIEDAAYGAMIIINYLKGELK